MNRWAFAMCVFVLVVAVLPAQTVPDFSALQAALNVFTDAVARDLASTAVTGLAWSPAHIGQFPHFGIGLSVGTTMMPYAAIEPFLTELGETLPTGVAFMESAGITLPSAVIDARIGGFGLPFDIGLKIGLIPESAGAAADDIQVEHFTVGGDLRFAILKDEGWRPGLSIGAGYSYLRGSLNIADVRGDDEVIDITALMTNPLWGGKPLGVYELVYDDPDIGLSWQSHVVEAKVQLSKKLFIFTPHLGFGAAYAIRSSIGGSIVSPVTYLEDGVPGNIDDVNTALANKGETEYPVDITLVAGGSAPGWTLQLFGGTSIDVWVIRIDLDAKWNVLTGSYGGNVNFRVEL
jgi:hypothetical protein